MVPSGICIGAFSPREMCSRTHRSPVWVSDRLQQKGMRNEGRVPLAVNRLPGLSLAIATESLQAGLFW